MPENSAPYFVFHLIEEIDIRGRGFESFKGVM
jgi:hypothetical protein